MMLAMPKSVGLPLSHIWKWGERAASLWKGGTIVAHVEHSGSLPSQHQLEMLLATPKSVGLPLSQIWKGGERAVSSWKGEGTIVAYVEPSLPSQHQLDYLKRLFWGRPSK